MKFKKIIKIQMIINKIKKNIRNQCENNKNHENHRNQYENNEKIIKVLEFHMIILKIMKIYKST